MGNSELKKLKKENLRILLVRNDKVGDLVLATPALRALRETYPESYIAMLVSEYAEDVVLGNPDLDEVIVDKKNGFNGFLKLLREIKGKRFDIVVILFPSFKTAVLAFLSRIPLRVSTGFKFYQFLFNRLIYLRRSKGLKHEIEYNLDLVRLIGADTKDKRPSIVINREDEEYVDKFLKEIGIRDNDLLIGLNPGSGLSARKWSEKHFGELAMMFKQKLNARILILWGPEEKELAERVLKFAKGAAEPAFKTSIRQIAALMKRCSLIVTNNTGPMHIAAAVGSPMVEIFDPKWACSPLRWGHPENGNIILKPEIDCNKKCDLEECEHFDCMDMITVDEVFKASCRVLENKKMPPSLNPLPSLSALPAAGRRQAGKEGK